MDRCCSGQELKDKIKNPKEVEKRVGRNGMWWGRLFKWWLQHAVKCIHAHINQTLSFVRCEPEIPPVPCSHVTSARLLAGLLNLARGEINKCDITLFAILLLDDPGIKYRHPHIDPHVHLCWVRHVMSTIWLDLCAGLLAPKSEERKAVMGLRQLRNEFVHELHLNPTLTKQMFDEKWQSIMNLLRPLARFAGGSVQQDLESETQKILAQEIDPKKETEFTVEFDRIFGQIDEVCAYTYTCMRV